MKRRAQGRMISYASNTGTKRNLAQLAAHGWRVLLTPLNPKWPDGFRCAIDNGAWSCFQQKLPFDSDAFKQLIEKHGAMADWIVIPDKVASPESLEFSESWMHNLRHFRLLLLPVQDGMSIEQVGRFLDCYPNVGIFLGGSTEWKLATMYGWGMVAASHRRYYHVARVNSLRRIRLAQEAGADSIDGTSGTLFSVTVPKLDSGVRQASLLTPKAVSPEAAALKRIPIRRSTKPLRRRAKPLVRIGKVSGCVRLSGAALEALRDRVYDRDRGRCQWQGCGKLLPRYGSVFTRAHLAHIVARSIGGSDTEENTRILCPPHHLISEHVKGLKG